MTTLADASAQTARRRRIAFHPLRVAEVLALCSDAAAITFAVPPELAAAYAFDPGQSLVVRRQVEGREERRSYSICSAPGEPLRIGMREIPDGVFSRWLVRDLAAGDLVEVGTPTGSFRAPPDVAGHHLFIAAGSGITPVLSLLATVLGNGGRATLLYGNRSTSSVMFVEELGDLKDRHGPRLEVFHVLSREPRTVDLFSGRLDADRLRRLLDLLVPLPVEHAWLCGPLGLVETGRAVLRAAGLARARMHAELFFDDTPPPAVRRDAPALVGGSQVEVVLDGRRTTVAVPAGATVLEASQRVRADLPFACRGGVCGTCRARLVEGEVEMARNYALSEEELAAGFVLTCQARPAAGRVTVDFDA